MSCLFIRNMYNAFSRNATFPVFAFSGPSNTLSLTSYAENFFVYPLCVTASWLRLSFLSLIPFGSQGVVNSIIHRTGANFLWYTGMFLLYSHNAWPLPMAAMPRDCWPRVVDLQKQAANLFTSESEIGSACLYYGRDPIERQHRCLRNWRWKSYCTTS